MIPSTDERMDKMKPVYPYSNFVEAGVWFDKKCTKKDIW